jgi:sarcosine oxidase subunit alpha
MQVTSQNRWPSLTFDVMAIFDRLHWFMPVGFYYKAMHKPRVLWPLFEKFIRRVAGLGSVDLTHGGKGHYDKLNLFSEVAVVGGGWAGLHAALAAADAGASVTLIDEQPSLGGHMRHDPHLTDPHLADVIQKVVSHERIEVIDSAVVFGCYEENLLGIQRGHRMIRLRTDQLIAATGGWERPLVFENNDLPGNLLASGAQRLLHLDGCRFDGTAVVVTDNPQGYRTARQLSQSGTQIVAIVDLNHTPCDDPGHFPLHAGQTIVAARGRKHVKAAVIEPLAGGPQTTISCRWIIQAIGLIPATSVLYQSGCRLEHDSKLGVPRVTSYARGTHSAGAVNGTHDPRACALEGRRSGLSAAAALRPDDTSLASRLAEVIDELKSLECHEPTAQSANTAHYVSSSPAKKKFVCLCEDVTEKDLCDAVDEGYTNIETLKRYSTISMGPCQGKMCQAASIAICARQNGQRIEQTGTTTSRPPEQPVPLGVLAGRTVKFSVIRRSAMQHWHTAANATFLDAGAWKRPERYADPAGEYDTVRKRVGLVDVSTLGKIELHGPDVVEFLEFVYPNRFAKLKVGRVRYGVVCDEAGMILDDGTIAHLEQERFFLTTTTGNADQIDSWFRWWLTCKPQLDVKLTNVTSGYAAMNLAGPHSREVMGKLCEADLSTEALPYLSAAQFEVAGVPAIVLRIGFVGELGYEIHVPTQYGLSVWKSILAAGEKFGIKPFGIEAQRRLRLDKKHILAGVDTDALSNPLEADLPWIVKLDKQDFIGRSSLDRAKQRGIRNRLVGFRIAGDEVPEEASLVIHDGKLGGRVTSARFSPSANATVGLAWVPIETANNGDTINIRLNGKWVAAVVQDEPFYDPLGEKLKS